jgi:GT2 family glycosyltransferase
LGFAKGCNLGAKKSGGEFILFLNSDTEIKDQGLLKMVNFLSENTKIGILGGKLKNTDGTNQLSAGKFYSLFNLFLMLFGFNKHLRESPNEIKRIDWVSGASFMVKSSFFEKIGGFDKDIFMYMEDMEFCFRAKKKGLETYFYPHVMLFHKELGSANKSFAILHIYKGILLFFRKHKSRVEFLIAKFLLFAKAFSLNLIGKVTQNSYYINTYGEVLKIF